jgi:hypothetical protein
LEDAASRSSLSTVTASPGLTVQGTSVSVLRAADSSCLHYRPASACAVPTRLRMPCGICLATHQSAAYTGQGQTFYAAAMLCCDSHKCACKCLNSNSTPGHLQAHVPNILVKAPSHAAADPRPNNTSDVSNLQLLGAFLLNVKGWRGGAGM